MKFWRSPLSPVPVSETIGPHEKQAWLPAALIIATGVYLLLFGFNSLTRIRLFTPDAMNYVNVARNIAQGHGITQSTLGFNCPRFSPADVIPAPVVTQPPLYPMMIALAIRCGLPAADAGLLISAACYGGVLLMAFVLAERAHSSSAGYVTVGLLLLYVPLQSIALKACSEPPGILLVLLALGLLARVRADGANPFWAAGAGIIAGLALATRYLFAPLAGVGLLLLYTGLKGTRRLRALSLYALGFALPAAVIAVRNWRVSGAILPAANPSTLSFMDNVTAAIKMLCGGYGGAGAWRLQACALAIAVGCAALALRLRRDRASSLQNVSGAGCQILLGAWTGAYLLFLIGERTRFHFDSISLRLIAPGGVTAVILLAVLLTSAASLKVRHAQAFALTVACLLIGREAWNGTHASPVHQEQIIAGSERLHWVAQNTTQRDLIFGDDTMDIPFYFPGRESVSFSPYPYTDYASYAQIMACCRAHRDHYDHMYLLLRTSARSEPAWQQSYGPFVTDLACGRMQSYPGVALRLRLKDAWVFELLCRSPEKGNYSRRGEKTEGNSTREVE